VPDAQRPPRRAARRSLRVKGGAPTEASVAIAADDARVSASAVTLLLLPRGASVSSRGDLRSSSVPEPRGSPSCCSCRRRTARGRRRPRGRRRWRCPRGRARKRHAGGLPGPWWGPPWTPCSQHLFPRLDREADQEVATNEKPPICGVFRGAPKRTRTSTTVTGHQALNPVHRLPIASNPRQTVHTVRRTGRSGRVGRRGRSQNCSHGRAPARRTVPN
jgi:hypothetical protein